MKFVSGVVKTIVTFAVVSAGMVLGTKAAETVYENGLGDKIKEASRKLFHHK